VGGVARRRGDDEMGHNCLRPSRQLLGPPRGSFLAVLGQLLVAAVDSISGTGGGEPSVTIEVGHAGAGSPVGL
jgi:hypothetical protein